LCSSVFIQSGAFSVEHILLNWKLIHMVLVSLALWLWATLPNLRRECAGFQKI